MGKLRQMAEAESRAMGPFESQLAKWSAQGYQRAHALEAHYERQGARFGVGLLLIVLWFLLLVAAGVGLHLADLDVSGSIWLPLGGLAWILGLCLWVAAMFFQFGCAPRCPSCRGRMRERDIPTGGSGEQWRYWHCPECKLFANSHSSSE